MRLGHFKYRRRSDRQQGYIMLLLALMVTVVLIALAAELPSISAQLRHDREEELIHRGAQYARAIKKYYRKFGAYPVSVDQLQNTNRMRFLRKRYKDPMTGEDFRLLHLGEVQLSLKAPGMATGPGVVPNSPFGAGPQTSFQGGASGTSTQAGAPETSTQAGASGQPGVTGQPSSPFVSPSQMGAKGPTFGGGPIIGVASTSPKQSFHVFNNKDHYKDWEFIYDPTSDRGGLIKGPYNGTQAFGFGGGQIPGAVSPGQMQPGAPAASPFGQSPFGQNPSSFGPSQQPQQPMQPQQPR